MCEIPCILDVIVAKISYTGNKAKKNKMMKNHSTISSVNFVLFINLESIHFGITYKYILKLSSRAIRFCSIIVDDELIVMHQNGWSLFQDTGSLILSHLLLTKDFQRNITNTGLPMIKDI